MDNTPTNPIVESTAVANGDGTITSTDVYANGLEITQVENVNEVAQDTADLVNSEIDDAVIDAEDDADEALVDAEVTAATTLTNEYVETTFEDGVAQDDDGVYTTTKNLDGSAYVEPNANRTPQDDIIDENIHGGIASMETVDVYANGDVVRDDGQTTMTTTIDGVTTIVADDDDPEIAEEEELSELDDPANLDPDLTTTTVVATDTIVAPVGTIVDDGTANPYAEADAAAAFAGPGTVLTETGVVDLLDEEDDD